MSILFIACQKPPLPEETEKEEGRYYEVEDEDVTPYVPPHKPHKPNNHDENNSSSNAEDPQNDYNYDKVLSVNEFLVNDYQQQVWVSGYIVGACAGNIKNAIFKAPFRWTSAILLADSIGETRKNKLISIQLKGRSVARNALNLVDHPENVGKKIKVFGFQNTYLDITGVKDWGNTFEWLP